MKIEEIQAEIKAIQERLNVLSTELKKCENDAVLSVWKPKEENEIFYSIEYGGYARIAYYENSYFIQSIIEDGNYYKTETEAFFEAQREKYTRFFRKYVKEHSEPLDWGNGGQEKWFCNYNHKEDCIGYNSNFYNQSIFIIYASSKEILEDAINFIGEDNFKKYILEVK